MRSILYFLPIFILVYTSCKTVKEPVSEFASTSTVPTGIPQSVMLTSYSTTLLANGTDHTALRIALTDSLGRQIMNKQDTIRIYVTGDGKVMWPNGKPLQTAIDTAGMNYTICHLQNGVAHLLFTVGTIPGKIKVEARSGSLWPGSHEIHTLPADFVKMTPLPDQLPTTTKKIGKMIGADISFLPQIEADGRKFTVNHNPVDAIQLLKQHGFNTIRLRIFVEPENEKGYSPVKGFCGLKYTLDMARRIKEAGMQCLLDFHYSDYWADPQQQYKPLRWANLDFNSLRDSVTGLYHLCTSGDASSGHTSWRWCRSAMRSIMVCYGRMDISIIRINLLNC